MATIYLAGGCFWGAEKYISSIRGVTETEVGYANGNTGRPTYKEVCNNNTGYAETVRVVYDPAVLPLDFLLELFYNSIDPTSVNRQGEDEGTQYRTGIYYTDESELPVIRRSVGRLSAKLGKPVAVEVKPLDNFWRAEEYHQKYLDKNPGGYCHISKRRLERAARAVVNPADYKAPAEEELRTSLTPEQFEVTRRSATEPPFKNAFYNEFRPGIYVDITTGEPLFNSADKFDSRCGWPSFTRPLDPAAVRELQDNSHGMARTEVRSRVGDAHLGHVFGDGPERLGGMRYCINSAALRFITKEDMEKEGYGNLTEFVK